VAGANAVALIGVTLYWGASRIKLVPMPWTTFDRQMRPWSNYQGQPRAFCRFNGSTIYIGPNPDQPYVTDWDTTYDTTDLPSDDSGTENMPLAMQTPVAYYAARLAKYNEQSMGESDRFLELYKHEMQMSMAGQLPFMADPYRG